MINRQKGVSVLCRVLGMMGAALLTFWFWSPAAHAQTYGACTVAASTIDLGDVGSYTVASTPVQSSGASGLSCTITANIIVTSYIKVKVVSSTFLLTGPSGQTIPFTLSSSAGGAALGIGSEADFSTTSLLSLFSGPNSSIPLYAKTTATSGLAAGTYSGTVTLNWYFSVCTVGVVACITASNSPGVTRSGLPGTASAWGTGAPVTVNITLDVLPDCQITAPNVTFGTAPLVGSFNAVTQSISVRCSKDSSYSVGLSDGANFSGTRRMRQGTTSNYLAYEIYRGASSSAGRWGSAIAGERRSSGTADSNPGIYDTVTLQGYTYNAAINTVQTTPAAGTYTDTVIVDIAF